MLENIMYKLLNELKIDEANQILYALSSLYNEYKHEISEQKYKVGITKKLEETFKSDIEWRIDSKNIIISLRNNTKINMNNLFTDIYYEDVLPYVNNTKIKVENILTNQDILNIILNNFKEFSDNIAIHGNKIELDVNFKFKTESGSNNITIISNISLSCNANTLRTKIGPIQLGIVRSKDPIVMLSSLLEVKNFYPEIVLHRYILKYFHLIKKDISKK